MWHVRNLLPLAAVTTSPEVREVQQARTLNSVEEGSVDRTETTTPAARTGQIDVRSDNGSSLTLVEFVVLGAGSGLLRAVGSLSLWGRPKAYTRRCVSKPRL